MSTIVTHNRLKNAMINYCHSKDVPRNTGDLFCDD